MNPDDFHVQLRWRPHVQQLELTVTLQRPMARLDLHYGDGTRDTLSLTPDTTGHRVRSGHRYAPGTYHGTAVVYDGAGRKLDRRHWTWHQA